MTLGCVGGGRALPRLTSGQHENWEKQALAASWGGKEQSAQLRNTPRPSRHFGFMLLNMAAPMRCGVVATQPTAALTLQM